MKNVIVIPARYGSVRFPGKPLAKVSGKSVIEWVISSAIDSKFADSIIVATEDEKIFDFINERIKTFKQKEVSVMITSDKQNSGTDRVAEVVKKIPEIENIVNLQGDEPLMPSEYIDKVFNLIFEESKKNIDCRNELMASLVTKNIDNEDISNPNIVKAVMDRNNYALYFSRSSIPYNRDQNLESNEINYFRHIGIYGYTRDSILRFSLLPTSILENVEKLEQLRALENGIRIKLDLVPKAFPAVDTPKDIKIVEEIINSRNKVY